MLGDLLWQSIPSIVLSAGVTVWPLQLQWDIFHTQPSLLHNMLQTSKWMLVHAVHHDNNIWYALQKYFLFCFMSFLLKFLPFIPPGNVRLHFSFFWGDASFAGFFVVSWFLVCSFFGIGHMFPYMAFSMFLTWLALLTVYFHLNVALLPLKCLSLYMDKAKYEGLVAFQMLQVGTFPSLLY